MASQVRALFLCFFESHEFDGRSAFRDYLERFDTESNKKGVVFRKCIPLQNGRAGRVDVVAFSVEAFKV